MTIALLLAAALTAPSDLWTLATQDTRAVLSARDGHPVLQRLECVTDGQRWTDSGLDVPLLREVWIGSQRQTVSWCFVRGTQDAEGTLLTLEFRCDAPSMVLQSIWRARPGRGPVEHWMTIRNDSEGPIAIPAQASLALLGLRSPAPTDLWWIKRGGSNASTEGGTFTERLSKDTNLVLNSNCDDGASPVPWLAVQSGNHGFYAGWEFSGLGRIEASARDDGHALGISIGLLPEFKTDLQAGEVFTVPPAFVGCYSGDIDEGTYALHQWILRYLRPRLPDDLPDPILAYNLYLDAGGANATEEAVLQSAAFCKELGFEAFMPDAMWFPACGDWRWDTARFPRGVTPIEEYVHQSGMRLALWCAWTNGGIAADPGALSVRGPVGHPDWFDSDFAPDWKPGPFYGGRICLASPEARAWATAKTQWLVKNHNLDYLKHDCGPIVTTCNKHTHRHHYGTDASYWATMGYYAVQDQLHAAFPNLILENCSGGGHIKDFGIIQRSHYTVTTDTLSNLPDRQSIYDSTFAFPPLLLQAYTYEREYKVPGDDPGSFLWRSAMMGAWQIDPTNTRIWTDDEKASAQRDAAIYKEWIRPMLKDVKVHHILPRPDGIHWDGLFYWSPGLKRGTVYVFRPDAPEDHQNLRLKGLLPEGQYWVWAEDGSVPAGVHRGADLMKEGLPAKLPARYSSDLVYVRDAAAGKPEGLDPPGAFALGAATVKPGEFQVSATFKWEASPQARSYRATLSLDPDFKSLLSDKTVAVPSLTLSSLPPGERVYWRVEAIGWGGTRRAEQDGMIDLPDLAPTPGKLYVSRMEWFGATAGAGNSVHRNSNYAGREIEIAGKVYPGGLWTHAFNDNTPADVTVSIAGQGCQFFDADTGVEDSAGNGSVQFQVIGDGQLLASSPVLHRGEIHPFHVDVSKNTTVILRVLNGGDGYACDHAAWGLARFLTGKPPSN